MSDEITPEAPRLNMKTAAIEMKRRQERIEASLARLAKLDASVTNVEGTRDKFLVSWIFQNVLSQEAQAAFTLAWLDEFQGQLTKLEGEARDAALAHTKQQLGVQAPGLIVPEHLRRSRS
jgi:hypothetical protein